MCLNLSVRLIISKCLLTALCVSLSQCVSNCLCASNHLKVSLWLSVQVQVQALYLCLFDSLSVSHYFKVSINVTLSFSVWISDSWTVCTPWWISVFPPFSILHVTWSQSISQCLAQWIFVSLKHSQCVSLSQSISWCFSVYQDFCLLNSIRLSHHISMIL